MAEEENSSTSGSGGDFEDCPCTNVTIMQLFHELKQKFPYVPDRVVTECIRKNGHDKGACEWALEKENRAYLLHSYPPGLGSRMASEENFEPSDDGFEGCCRHQDHLHLPSAADGGCISSQMTSDFERRIPGRQSLDSLYRRHRSRKNVTFKHYSDEYLHHPSTTRSTENVVGFEEATSGIAPRLPFLSCDYSGDDLNLTVMNGSEYGGSANVRCQNASFIRDETTSSTAAASSHDRERPANRPSTLVNNETDLPCADGGGSGDLRLKFESDVKSCRCERTSVSVVSSCNVERGLPKGPHSAPVTPSGFQPPLFPPLSLDVTMPRHRTALSVEPSPPYMADLDSPSQRPFTRVNLTLRPPSSEPQPPIDIRSSAGGGLTYSTCSYDPRQGFQSRLRISIGPGGQGLVSAARTKTTSSVQADHSPSVAAPSSLLADSAVVGCEASSSAQQTETELLDPQVQAIVKEQLNRKQRLENELAKEKERLKTMQQDVAAMERDLNIRRSKISKRSKVQELKEEISRLFAECKYMTAEVDFSLPDRVPPFGETREDFYSNIYRGQEGCLRLQSQTVRGSSDHRHQAVAGPSRLEPHHRLSLSTPPAAAATTTEAISAAATLTGSDGPNWTCSLCTFRNHPLLEFCEQCEMPRGVFGKRKDEPKMNTV